MEINTKSIYKTTRIMRKLIGAFYIYKDTARACAETGLTEDEIEKIVGGRYPPSHKNAGRLKGRITIDHQGISIRNGSGDKIFWTKPLTRFE